MFFGTLTIANDGFSMVFGSPNHWFQWFSMVKDHWSNDGMVSMDRPGLYSGDKWRCHIAGQTTTWKDRATQLLICESLSFAISPESLHLLKSTDSPNSPDSPESSDSPKSPDSPNLPKSHRLETVWTTQKLSGQSRNCPDNPKIVRTIPKMS